MYYIRGKGFDSLQELFQMQPPNDAMGWVSVTTEIANLFNDGFASHKHSWCPSKDKNGLTKKYEELWFVEEPGGWVILHVPGDGRGDTRDSVLLYSGVSSLTEQEFIEADRRKQAGGFCKW